MPGMLGCCRMNEESPSSILRQPEVVGSTALRQMSLADCSSPLFDIVRRHGRDSEEAILLYWVSAQRDGEKVCGRIVLEASMYRGV